MSAESHKLELLATTCLTGHGTDAQKAEFDGLWGNDAAFRDLVGEIEVWLAPLGVLAEEVTPPAGLFDEIMRQIDADGARVEPPAIADDLNVWRIAAIVAAVVAVVAAGLNFVPRPAKAVAAAPVITTAASRAALEPDAARGQVAVLAGEDAPVVVILHDPEANKVRATLSNVNLPEDGVWQLWLVREGTEGPESLGVFETRPGTVGQGELALDHDLIPDSDRLAISLEPAGGSPEAGPTGQLIFTGRVRGL